MNTQNFSFASFLWYRPTEQYLYAAHLIRATLAERKDTVQIGIYCLPLLSGRNISYRPETPSGFLFAPARPLTHGTPPMNRQAEQEHKMSALARQLRQLPPLAQPRTEL